MEHHSSTKPSPKHFESTRQNTMTTGKHTKSFTETNQGTSPIRLITDLLPTDGYHHADTQHSGHGGLSSIGRVIAGAICGGVVTFGVFLIVCISHCRLEFRLSWLVYIYHYLFLFFVLLFFSYFYGREDNIKRGLAILRNLIIVSVGSINCDK